MKRFTTLLTAALFILTVMAAGNLAAQDVSDVQHGLGFVDADGDGYNDNAPDADGDGIPNGQDPDYVRASQSGAGFVDEDGDGINDNAGLGGNRNGLAQGDRPQDGTGNKYGYGKQGGSGNPGTGDCTGEGPRGLGRGRK